jgi:hypothetical protein
MGILLSCCCSYHSTATTGRVFGLLRECLISLWFGFRGEPAAITTNYFEVLTKSVKGRSKQRDWTAAKNGRRMMLRTVSVDRDDAMKGRVRVVMLLSNDRALHIQM